MDRLGYPQLIDFGCAKQFDPEVVDCRTLTLCGTPRFVSPEMIEPEKYGGGHSFGTDYWALGILMYEMLMGQNPFEYDGMSETEIYESILDEDFHPSLADEHSLAAKDFLRRLLVHDPSRRLGRKNHDSRILQHRWFADVDLPSLRRKPPQTAPWSPDLSDSSDSHYFDEWENVIDSKFNQSYPSLSTSQRQLFANF
jgi:protein kinase A